MGVSHQRKTFLTSLVVSLVLGALSSSTGLLAQPAPTFGQPTISGIQGVGFEQDLRLDPTNSNRVYTSVPGSLSSDTSWIWHSEDGGKTFKWVVAGTAKEGKPDLLCPGGGDTELAVDSVGDLYFNDLTLANFSTARSEDDGDTFVCSQAGVPDAAVDRQWYAVDGNPRTGTGLDNGAGHNIYLANDEIGPGAVMCPVSGFVNNVLAMYRSPTMAGGATAGIQFGPGYKVSAPSSCDEGIMGNDEVSPVATKTGKLDQVTHIPATLPVAVKHVYVIHDDATFSRILIGRCFPVLFGVPLANMSDPSGLNCDDLPVATLGTIPTGGMCPTAKTGGNFPTLAIDNAGNLYAVWEQAPQDPFSCKITGDTVLKYSYSTNEGSTWSTPRTIPTPGLHNNVFAWVAAGDNGRVDIAWYGTPAMADPNYPTCGTNNGGHGGPDATNGIWSLYMVQTLNGHSASPTFTAPILAGEHYVHKGTIQTVLGGQCGDRTLGDFLQLRVGNRGEAQIAYADSNNPDEPFAPHGMYVKQNGGAGLFTSSSPVHGDPILLNAASDPAGDGKRETNGISLASDPNLDILFSSFSQPTPANCHPAGTPCYRVKTTVNNLSLAPPLPDTVAVWLTQWLVPADPACTSSSDSCTKGGKNPFVYLESNGTCWSGENAAQLLGGGVTLTYPGTKQITAPGACSFTLGPLKTISIDVPIADVSLDPGVAPLSSRLYSVTASTMTLTAPPESVPPNPGNFQLFTGPIGGVLFDLIDVVRAYDFLPGAGGGGGGGGCRVGDGDGHINGEHSGQASFHFHKDECDDDGDDRVDANDPSGNMDFHSTQILSVGFDDVAHTVTISGLGTDNGLPVAFTAVGVDSTLVPPGLFSITLSDGYSNSGDLIDGSIALQ
ncbi:MAG: hypothetical protein WAU32_07510 [Thermoanaerobaculia bacterium]